MSNDIANAVRAALGRITAWNLQVGKGVVTPKNAYRVISPGSQPITPTKGSASLKLPVKQEDLADQRYDERATRMLRQSMGSAYRTMPEDPMLDPRNLYGANFSNLPPTPPIRLYVMREYNFNSKGIRVDVAEIAKEKEAEK